MVDTEQAERDVIANCERLRYDAMLRGDSKVLDAIFAEEAVYTHSTGERDSKRSYIDKVARRYFDYMWIERPEQDIVVVGDVAIVVGRMTAEVKVEHGIRRLDNRNLAVWVRRDGRWLFLAHQPTVMTDSGAI